MTGEGVNGFHLGADGVQFAEDVDFFVAAGEPGTEGVLGTPTDDEDGVVFVLDGVVDVVPDAAGFGHAGRAEDNAGLGQVVERHGFFDALDVGDIDDAERIFTGAHGGGKWVVEGFEVPAEDGGGVDSQWAVHVNRQGRDAAGLLELVKRVEQLLRATDGKGGDDNFSAALDGAIDDAADAVVHIAERFVNAAAVGAFGN